MDCRVQIGFLVDVKVDLIATAGGLHFRRSEFCTGGLQ